MTPDERMKKVYAAADHMREQAVARSLTVQGLLVLGEGVVAAAFCWLYPPVAYALAAVAVTHALLLRAIARRIRAHHIWVWNLIISNTPDPAYADDEWIRKLLYLYAKRMKYRPSGDDEPDPADWWKWN
jgi:hypothetical protein